MIQAGAHRVKWRPGKETSLASQCSNLQSFGSDCIVLKKEYLRHCWVFSAPTSELALGTLCPSCPLCYAPRYEILPICSW